MIRLTKSRNAWGTPGFKEVLRQELEQLDADQLHLQQALSTGSYAKTDSLKVMVISSSEASGLIRAKAGVFFTGIIAGCSCADDPTPIDELSEYCELQIRIDKTTAETTVELCPGYK